MPEKADLTIDALLAEFDRVLRAGPATDPENTGLTKSELMRQLGIGEYQFIRLIQAADSRGVLRRGKKACRNSFGDRQVKPCYWIDPPPEKPKKR